MQPTQPAQKSVFLQIFCFFAIITVIIIATPVLVVGKILLFHPNLSAIRRNVHTADSAHVKKVVELSAGPILFATGRTALSFVKMDPEIRPLLESVRSAEVGIYKFSGNAAEALETMSENLTRDGYTTLARVQRRNEYVGVFVSSKNGDESDFKTCVVVFNKKDLVIVSGRADLRPAFEFARNHIDSDLHFALK